MGQKKILVVDDDKFLLEIIISMLVDTGYDVSSFTDPIVALGKVQSEPFDLILTDYNMPSKNGLEFLKEAKRINNKTPIIMISGGDFGSENQGDTLNSICFYADEVIGKPFNKNELLSTIEDLLENRLII